MDLGSLDLNIENYSIKELKNLLGINNNYTSNELQEKCNGIISLINENEDMKLVDKHEVLNFFDSIRVTLIRHINGQEGMFNELYNVNNIELQNTIIEKNGGNEIYRELDSKKKSIHEKKRIENSEMGGVGTLNAHGITDDNFHYTEKGENEESLATHVIKYKKDKLNPIKHETITRCITFDTRFRENYSTTMSTDFNCTLPDRISNVISMQLSAMEFPTSYLIFNDNAKNNFFNYQVLDSGTISEIKTVTLKSGNYSHSELIDQINDNFIRNGDSIEFSVDITSQGSGTGKTIIRNTSTQLINIYFDRDKNGQEDPTPLPLKFGWVLGFRNGEYTKNKEYVSEGMYEDHGSKYLYLSINDHNNNTYDTYLSVFNSSMLNKNILARISMKTPAFFIHSENGMNLTTEPRLYMGPVTLSKFNVQVLDEFGRIVDINNMDYSFCLNIVSLYK
tara:strand:+ start:2622 stop:3971 length:1350 start_codon:yes stop_codon:yes gene_type:complete